MKKIPGDSVPSHSHVKPKEAKRILAYSYECLKVLRLSHWAVHLAYDAADDGTHAATDTAEGRYITTVYVPSDWSGKPELLKRRTLMHEMIHAVHAEQSHTVDKFIRDGSAFSKDLYDTFDALYMLATEYMVDRLTSVIEDLGGLPAWPDDKTLERYAHTEAMR